MLRNKSFQSAVISFLIIAFVALLSAEITKPVEAGVPGWLAKKVLGMGSADMAKSYLESQGYIVFAKPWYFFFIPTILWYALTAAQPVY